MSAHRSKGLGNITARPSGLTIGGKNTLITLVDSGWTKLPATNLTSRNTIGIQNNSLVDIAINFVASGIVTDNWQLGPGGEFFTDITDGIDLFGRSSSGSATVIVLEEA